MRTWTLATLMVVAACGGPTDSDETLLEGDECALEYALSDATPSGTALKTTASAKLRGAAAWSAAVLSVMPAGAAVTSLETPQSGNDFLRVRFGEQTGYAVRSYLTAATSGSGTPPPSNTGDKVGPQKLTFYYSALESQYSDAPSVAIYSGRTCAKIATISPNFFKDLKIEGSGKLNDGRGLGYYGACSCATSPCFTEMSGATPWGVGASGNALIPFRSIAVDRANLTMKSWYYAKELDGVTMPGTPPTGGWVHDGCVRADDSGSGIVGSHIDFMAGTKAWADTLIPRVGKTLTLFAAGSRCK